MAHDDLSQAAHIHLRSHREGTLLADGTAHRIRFVIDGRTGRLVFPASTTMAQAGELVLFIPDEEPQDSLELQLLLAPAEVNPDQDEACDHWRAYHGEPRLTRWLACGIEAARFAGDVVEPEPLNAANPLHTAEPALCRILNSDRNRLAAVCEARAGVAPREPLAVGVDNTGFDIRARFGIIRIGFVQPARTPEDAESMIRSTLEHPST